MYSKLAVVAVVLAAAAGVFADDFTNNCNVQKRVCQNGGVCHENLGSIPTGSRNAWKDPFCICQAPYGDNDCSRTIRECKDNPCQNGGTCNPASCISSHNSESYDCFTCTCPFGWTGAPSYAGGPNPGGVCDWKLMGNDCRNGNLCANGGNCTNISPSAPYTYGYQCVCPTGYLGGQTSQGGVFANVAYNCTVPDCTTTDGACQNGGVCNTGSGLPTSRRCSCGFYGGSRCELPRFCDNPTACPDGYTCTNTGPGTGSCQAPSFCSTHTCLNGGTCHNSGGPNGDGYCSCPAPYDGYNSCNSTLFCQSNPCQNGGTCNPLPSYIGGQGSCSCTNNFGGTFCEKPMVGCAQDRVACAPGASCSTDDWVSTCGCGSTTGGLVHFDCRCNSTTLSKCPGTSGSLTGQNADMVCQNGATCLEVAETTGCDCRPGFWGDKCQNYDNPCLNSPCENGGQCYMIKETQGAALDDRTWAWRCKCKWPFYGKNCEKQAPVPSWDGKPPVVCGASNSPCLNGGTCSARAYDNANGGFFDIDPYSLQQIEAEPWQCTCPQPSSVGYGYKGLQCEVQIEQCSATTCQNNGKCSNFAANPPSTPFAGLQCSCPCGYAGDRCEFPATNINANSVAQFANDGAGGVGYRLEFCSREPCQNGGTCYHSLDGQGFVCSCKSGWSGTTCQYSVRSAAAGVVPSLVAVAAALAVAFALKH